MGGTDCHQDLRIVLLRERHQQLDDEIDEANLKTWLSSSERQRIKELKVRRLRLRDIITSLEGELMS